MVTKLHHLDRYGCWNYDGRRHLTHRVSYRLLVGEIPAGLEIDHLCANRLCCNPAHLEAVTSEVNSRRSHTATKTLCVNGHQLAGENLIIKRRANGKAPGQSAVSVPRCIYDRGILELRRGLKEAVDHRDSRRDS